MTTWWIAPYRYIERSTRPRPIEAVGETPKFLLLPNGRREARDTQWRTTHPTERAAWDAILARARARESHAASSLKHAQEVLTELLNASSNEGKQP